ncbi:MAG TPA: acyl carrier protein [Gemmataceae bacterium]|nr:acyl carrier protein [Gemmataceae bacterium]
MDRETLRHTLASTLEENTGEKYSDLNDQVNLRTDLGLDSVDFVQLVIQLQSEYGIVLETRELENITRVGDFLNLLEAKLSAKEIAA